MWPSRSYRKSWGSSFPEPLRPPLVTWGPEPAVIQRKALGRHSAEWVALVLGL